MKEFTLAEVAVHNTRDDLYMIIRDEVYEISKFVAEVSFSILIYSKILDFGNLTSISLLYCSTQVKSIARTRNSWSK